MLAQVVARGDHKGKYSRSKCTGPTTTTPRPVSDRVRRHADEIALWMLDPDYDEPEPLPAPGLVSHGRTTRDGWARLARNLKAEIDLERIVAYRGTVSLPIESGAHKRVAVKIVDDRGIESLKVIPVP